MRALDLFCGAGGAGMGLHRAGYTVHGYDAWPVAVDTHNANGLPATVLDLSVDDPPHPGHPFLMWASPPCQPFSAAGDGGGEFDDRDGFPWMLRIVERQLPEVLIVENVKGLTFSTHADYFARNLAALMALGYDVQWRVLNTADYGVPQTRERCIIIARRDGGPITWPAPTHTEHEGLFTAKWVTMAEALGRPVDGVDYRQTGGDGTPCYHRTTGRPSPTVSSVACGQWLVEPGRAHLSIADAAAIQGLPPDWRWCGTKTAQAKQIGNAVPPALAHALAAANRPLEARAAA